MVGVGWGAGAAGDNKPTFTKFQDGCDETNSNSGCFIFGDDSTARGSETLQKLELSSVSAQDQQDTENSTTGGLTTAETGSQCQGEEES